jgi:hypothetical protein
VLLALSLIRDVFQYACGVGQGKSLAFETKLRAQKRIEKERVIDNEIFAGVFEKGINIGIVGDGIYMAGQVSRIDVDFVLKNAGSLEKDKFVDIIRFIWIYLLKLQKIRVI